jgi:membrane protein DedA with SNARE-associated domain
LRLGWNDKFRKVLAAALYAVGVAWVLFVAYEDWQVPNSILRHPLLFVGGMALVVVAALLWPVRSQGEKDAGTGDE